MSYSIQPLIQEDAQVIAYEWHYEKPYDFYDMEADHEDFLEFVNPNKRKGPYYSLYEAHSLIGFFSAIQTNDTTINLGLGMHPSMTGQGKGQSFLESILSFIKNNFFAEKIELSVATFNKRAIRAYEKVGFKAMDTFMQKTNGSTFEFLKMERKI